MKKAWVLVLALLLVFTGCTGKKETKNASVKDVCCPYEVVHKDDGVQVVLSKGKTSVTHWQVEAVPAEICQVTQDEVAKEDTWRYRIAGNVEGAAKLTFTGVQEDETTALVLTLVVDVGPDLKAAVSSCQHWEGAVSAVEAEGLTYKWNVDAEGVLRFSFINSEDGWCLGSQGEGVFTLWDMMATSNGYKFSAQAGGAGETTVVLVGEQTNREIRVTLRADEDGKMEVKSVQEQ